MATKRKKKKRRLKIEPVAEGYNRQWTRCTSCGNIAYRDYVPYSLSNPLIYCLKCTGNIGCRYEDSFEHITTDEALAELVT